MTRTGMPKKELQLKFKGKNLWDDPKQDGGAWWVYLYNARSEENACNKCKRRLAGM